MDYCVPRADHAPGFAVATAGTACRNNPLGIKGAGGVGATGAPPAVVSAVLDALSALGVEAIDMPMNPRTGVAGDSRGPRVNVTAIRRWFRRAAALSARRRCRRDR